MPTFSQVYCALFFINLSNLGFSFLRKRKGIHRPNLRGKQYFIAGKIRTNHWKMSREISHFRHLKLRLKCNRLPCFLPVFALSRNLCIRYLEVLMPDQLSGPLEIDTHFYFQVDYRPLVPAWKGSVSLSLLLATQFYTIDYSKKFVTVVLLQLLLIFVHTTA